MAHAAFDGSEPLHPDAPPADDERPVADAARACCQEALLPRVQRACRDATTDPTIFRETGQLGRLGPAMSERYGGAGLDAVCYRRVAPEVGRADSADPSTMSVRSSPVMVPIEAFGSEAQKQKYLPPLARAETVGCFGLAEPAHGQDRGGGVTRAHRVAGGYRLSGAKTWITDTPIADVFLVLAKVDEGANRGFVFDEGAQGLRAPAIHGRVGSFASDTGEIVMDEVFCTDENAFPEVRGPEDPFTCLNSARYAIVWGALGAAEDDCARARLCVPDPQQFGRPLPVNRTVRQKLADTLTEITLALHACRVFGRLMDAGGASVQAAPLLARTTRDMLGGGGISDDDGIARHLVSLDVVTTCEGTHHIHALTFGRAITGIAAFH